MAEETLYDELTREYGPLRYVAGLKKVEDATEPDLYLQGVNETEVILGGTVLIVPNENKEGGGSDFILYTVD